MVIFDTNILIELYRGNPAIQEQVRQIKSDIFYVSAITAAEFIVGAKNKDDQKRIESDLSKYTIMPLSSEITDVFIDLFKTYTLSRRPGIPDTLIAATVLYYDLPLYTLNRKHFQFLPGIKLI